jgi:serine/threonine protein kinase
MVSALWQHWQGQIIDGSFPLLRYLGGNERSAAFQTSYGASEPRLATIKLVLASSEDGEIIARWNRAAQLCHPHLVRLFHVGTYAADGIELFYCVMEHAEEDLASVLRDRPLTAAEAHEMLNSVLDALAYVHGKGFAYAHLRPTNILAVDDCIKISSDCIVRAGEVIRNGEPPSAYDPPEVQDLGYSPSGDIWSLGVTLTEVLNQHARRGRSVSDEVHSSEAIPGSLVEIARGCLQRDPLRRATVRDILAQLRTNSSKDAAQRTESRYDAFWTRRYIIPVAAIALSTVVAGVGLVHRRAAPQPTRSIIPAPASVPEGAKPSDSGSDVRQPPQREIHERQVDPDVPSTSPRRPEEGSSKSGAPQIVYRVAPNVPQKALETIHGTVRVSVRAHVDSSGRVKSVALDSTGPSSYFAQLSLQAARQWEFGPIKGQAPNGTSDWLLRFEFTRTGTRVHAVRVSEQQSSDRRR